MRFLTSFELKHKANELPAFNNVSLFNKIDLIDEINACMKSHPRMKLVLG